MPGARARREHDPTCPRPRPSSRAGLSARRPPRPSPPARRSRARRRAPAARVPAPTARTLGRRRRAAPRGYPRCPRPRGDAAARAGAAAPARGCTGDRVHGGEGLVQRAACLPQVAESQRRVRVDAEVAREVETDPAVAVARDAAAQAVQRCTLPLRAARAVDDHLQHTLVEAEAEAPGQLDRRHGGRPSSSSSTSVRSCERLSRASTTVDLSTHAPHWNVPRAPPSANLGWRAGRDSNLRPSDPRSAGRARTADGVRRAEGRRGPAGDGARPRAARRFGA